MLKTLTSVELQAFRGQIHILIMMQKPGKYTIVNKVAKMIDKYTEVGE